MWPRTGAVLRKYTTFLAVRGKWRSKFYIAFCFIYFHSFLCRNYGIRIPKCYTKNDLPSGYSGIRDKVKLWLIIWYKYIFSLNHTIVSLHIGRNGLSVIHQRHVKIAKQNHDRRNGFEFSSVFTLWRSFSYQTKIKTLT